MDDEHFEFPILTVDGVVFQLVEGTLHILLIERGFEPFLGVWALPGAYVPKDKSTRDTLDTTLIQKTGISVNQLALVEQPYAFDAPKRDPRGYAVTVMYIGLGRDIVPGMHTGMTLGQNPQFKPVNELPTLAYDHANIVKFAHSRLKTLAASTNAVAALMPPTFTLAELQTAYEAIFCQQLDKRNFRKKIFLLDMLAETGGMRKNGAHRPARLYRFVTTKLQPTSETFA